ncbi:HIRAN domain-containing protein [Lactiplantibacillus plajomi]|uniref:HIRAN domain-containing protein n=1 Tax=Lactiplantibacillus plajomi TaxID=1457217 RepID=A0ABV6K670_9LACO|nr:HIRAN domain-containing protein [Lactiplantibacillus plajomi]
MQAVEVGMRITATDQQAYRVMAIIDQGHQFLVQAENQREDVRVINADEVVQLTEQSSASADVALDTVNVVGQRYVENVEAAFADLTIGMPVLLQREAENEHDHNAITVWTLAHARLGYVARYQNQVYADLLDQGQLLYGTVSVLDAAKPHLEIMLWRTSEQASPVAAMRIRQRVVAPTKPQLATIPHNLVDTPLGDVMITCNGRPLPYQVVPLSPWLSPADELRVSQRYLLTPDWSKVTENSVVACYTTTEAQVIQRWQAPTENGVILTNANSFYVVGLSTVPMTGANDNLSNASATRSVIYRVGDVATHARHGFIVSWVPFGDPRAQPSLAAALRFPEQPVVPFSPVEPKQQHATFNRQELAALLVSGLPNYQGGLCLEPSVSDLTVEKLRVTLGDTTYHALANYQEHVQLMDNVLEDVNQTLAQALIHAVVYHEIATLHYFMASVGMVTQPIYPVHLYTATAQDDDQKLVGYLAFYNYATFDFQQVALTAIASLAVIAHPEHPQPTESAPNPDWREIFMHSWNDMD